MAKGGLPFGQWEVQMADVNQLKAAVPLTDREVLVVSGNHALRCHWPFAIGFSRKRFLI